MGFAPLGRVGLVHFEQYSLGESVSVFWCIESDHACLKVSAVSSNVFWVVFTLGIALGSLSANGQGCVPHFLPALSRKNSGEETEGKEKSKEFFGKAKYPWKDTQAN